MITEGMIPKIEQAFGFHLYDWQKDYLLEKPYTYSYGRRRSGRAFAYCIKLLLSDGKLIKRRDLFKHSCSAEHGTRDWRWFAEYALEINDKLVAAGFETRMEK